MNMKGADSGPVYTIGAVARMVGVAAATLRNWEERYSLIKPERSRGGHRLYSRQQVEQLRFVVTNVEQGMPPADAHRLLSARLAVGEPLSFSGPPVGSRFLIMLATRDQYSAEFAEYFLKTEGYETVVVLDRDEAEGRVDMRSPDLAVVDLLISGGEGYELCRTIKERGVSLVLAISALESREEALDSGADAFLQKPIEPLKLISTVKDLLGTSAYLRSRARST